MSTYAGASDYLQVAGLIDTRTTHSDGALSVEGLADLARTRGFDVLFVNDHDRLAMAYGLPPFQNVLRYRKDLNSINVSGAQAYIDAIDQARAKFSDLILVPGSESVPYYYWTGSYFKNNLTAHDHEKRILTIGLENAEDYKKLPILHNGLSTRYIKQALPGVFFFLGSLFLGLYLLTEKGLMRVAAAIIVAISLLAIVNTAPLRSSPFTQYMGNQGHCTLPVFHRSRRSSGRNDLLELSGNPFRSSALWSDSPEHTSLPRSPGASHRLYRICSDIRRQHHGD